MRLLDIITLSIFAGTVYSQNEFEPANFHVIDALTQNGVNVSEIPELSGLTQRSSVNACSIACNSLAAIFPSSDQVLNPSSPAYAAFTSQYWAQQQNEAAPTCVFKPAKALDVSTLILISRLTQCQFAVKSGGHAGFAGSSSIAGGVTVALERMKEITLSADRKVAGIEPGNRWFDVYSELEKQDLAVIGGRVAPIGVGGLTLGGGISFFSNEYGWACDNVASYEVVTASGALINVSTTTFPDLYWALRGGGNNFGVVTKFYLKTIPQGRMWGGPRQFLEPEFPAVIDAFYNLAKNSENNTKAAQILSFAYAGMKIAVTELEYAEPIADAPILAEYMAIPALQDDTGIRNLSELTVGLDASSKNGSRHTFWTATFKLDKEFVRHVVDMAFEELIAISDMQNSTLSFSLQVITQNQLEKMAQNGGNALGLSVADGPLVNLLCGISWENSADDGRVMKACLKVVERTLQDAGAKGLAKEYIYMPYASPYQNVIPSYGVENQQKLNSIAKKYDPKGVFQTLQPGYFKLDGAPFGNLP